MDEHELKYVRTAKKSIDLIEELRKILLSAWEEGKEKEFERIKVIKSMYEDIIVANKKAFGENAVNTKTVG